MLPTPFTFTTEKRQNRSLIQDVTPFLNNIIFQYTNPLPFETEPHILQTIPLVREHVILIYIISNIKHLTLHHHKPLFKLFLILLKE